MTASTLGLRHRNPDSTLPTCSIARCGVIQTGCTPAHEGAMENILRWFARIGEFLKPSAHFWRSRQHASDIAAETLSESATQEVGVIATGAESVPPNTSAPLRAPVTADAIGQAQVGCVISIQPDQQEIQRRRELVRTLFNDFWRGCDEKPGTFADRLDQAESYLNERLAACGECWQLDAKTRKILCLPRRSNSSNEESAYR